MSRPTGSRSRRKRVHSFSNTFHIGNWGSARRHSSQGLHACPFTGLRGGVKVAKGSHNIIRGADGRILKERSTGPAESPFLEEGGNPGDDSIRESIRVIARLAAFTVVRRPEFGPDPADPI